MTHVTEHEKELFLSARRDAHRWQVIGFLGALIGVASIIGWLIILPLKEIRAVPFSIDPDTKVPVLLTEKVQKLDASEGMAFREIADYVRARETYDVQDNQERIGIVLRRSDEIAETSFRDLWDGSNPDHPDEIYTNETKVLTDVLGVTPVNETTAQVEIRKTLVVPNQPDTSARYVITVTYGFEEKIVTSMDELLENPFGFIVTNYRVDAMGDL
ncbi:virB8 family protein [uncultured Ruegeria sp.]|uniref:virB8 family protein n=1 Tax=uncultured Ruegeria sp. TaxID=259304 RepID=UPI002623CBCD|nr:type IV secretion system protein [uncultured Ruegeria sp.]